MINTTINYTTIASVHLADTYTPVGMYLRIRDYFRDSVLLESNNTTTANNSYSFIGVKALAGIEMKEAQTIEYRLPMEEAKTIQLQSAQDAPTIITQFLQQFKGNEVVYPLTVAQSVLGYMGYEGVQLFEQMQLSVTNEMPLLRFRFYQYIIAFNHYKDEYYLIENKIEGIESEPSLLETLIQKKDVPKFPFTTIGKEESNSTDDDYINIVQKGIAHCQRGNVFQVVLSRQFTQAFQGDDFNVYRHLRSINPSPYLFYFDYGSYRIMGSSPESQLLIQNGKATVHPIAGTCKRTGNSSEDEALAATLLQDAKENAEHTMLVDLARNDLSIFCNDVTVNYYKNVQYYSHLIHLVSEVQGILKKDVSNIKALGLSFPAGTLSGAPKYRAMQIINELEQLQRGFYAGTIGILGFNGDCNMAILIRSFFSKNNVLTYRAGAGIVAASNPESELQEVNNKIAALRKAIENAAL